MNRVLDRVPSFDERSRQYPVRALLPGRPRESYTWRVGVNLDQGTEGACVGFAWAHELAAKPVVVGGINDAAALNIYRTARTLDVWEGENYDGTSVIAGAKAVMGLARLKEYRWAFGEADLRAAVPSKGPAVLGVWWWTGMWDVDAEGYIHPTGVKEGGHAICCFGYSKKKGAYALHNSWGPSWGRDGVALVRQEEMAELLADEGEACIPVMRG